MTEMTKRGNIDKVKRMFNREHFPIVLNDYNGAGGGKVWSFSRIEIPPYHPLIKENGIDFRSVPGLLRGVVEATVKDLEDIADRNGTARRSLQYLVYLIEGEEAGKVLCKPKIINQDDGITIDGVPIVNRIYVDSNKINPWNYNGDNGISLNLGHAAPSFYVPEGVTFSPELMREYEMKDYGVILGSRKIECPNGWYRHNLGHIDAIFYKNLVMALDNAIVEGKYP
jgi:hypothetical protein